MLNVITNSVPHDYFYLKSPVLYLKELTDPGLYFKDLTVPGLYFKELKAPESYRTPYALVKLHGAHESYGKAPFSSVVHHVIL